MSGRLVEIKKRIGSTKNTKKITKAMYLESSTKMKQFQDKALSSRLFAWDLLRILGKIINEETENNTFVEKRKTGKILFLLYTSDKGLCGSLNTRLINTLFESKIWKSTPESNRLLITIGKKSYDYARFNDIKIEKSFQSLSENLTPIESASIIDDITQYWTSGEIKQVIMAAPHYKNTVVFYPIMKTYLPFSKDMVNEHIGIADQFDKDLNQVEKEGDQKDFFTDEPYMIFEPSEQSFRETLTQYIVHALFLQSFFELKAAEYSNRAMAMKNATDAAQDMIDSLTLNFNKARQAEITQEIAEIMAGGETV